MKNLLLILVAAAFAASPSSATTLNYLLTSGADTITFALPQIPTPSACAVAYDCFSVTTPVTIDGATDSGAIVSFYTPADGGGLTILEGATVEVNNAGPGHLQLFSGTLFDPILESFSNLQLVGGPYYSPFYNESFVLNASASGPATPEPATLWLTGLALTPLLWLMWQRRQRARWAHV